ncbi:MAG: DNA-directed RNA polymerase subunit delta [Bacilli bacterium]|nr:DNA-directed RNA polymerase subunit delta [Erysipelotrichaceae bacterium]MDD6250748.1 DNA-directed RNA polymerase subunit delta [Bacillales bacterium]MDY2745786.1 DNA-directed RNA polymerase subunit delta [Bacilli bacterium]MDD7382398.1 DNA-directed RNA polymerase subunit delta [Bacillales bacterium]MDY3890329.1 DNA-directed RNA polymerase subunit delta [Bacilli bacterium]
MNKSNLDVAYEIVKNVESISFNDLWNQVAEVQNYTEEEKATKVGKFYTNLILDGRFVNLGDNVWDLRERNTFDKVHIDMSECYSEEEEDLDPEDIAEEKEEEGIVDDTLENDESKTYQEDEEI